MGYTDKDCSHVANSGRGVVGKREFTSLSIFVYAESFS